MVLWPIAYYYYYYGAHVLFELFYKDTSSVERKITELVTSTFISHELVTISSLNDVVNSKFASKCPHSKDLVSLNFFRNELIILICNR